MAGTDMAGGLGEPSDTRWVRLIDNTPKEVMKALAEMSPRIMILNLEHLRRRLHAALDVDGIDAERKRRAEEFIAEQEAQQRTEAFIEAQEVQRTKRKAPDTETAAERRERRPVAFHGGPETIDPGGEYVLKPDESPAGQNLRQARPVDKLS